jgi:hypothetical protein
MPLIIAVATEQSDKGAMLQSISQSQDFAEAIRDVPSHFLLSDASEFCASYSIKKLLSQCLLIC